MNKGICVAGLMVQDTIYRVARYPAAGELAPILGPSKASTGGAVCNVLMSLARLDPGLPLVAQGVLGADEAGDFVLARMREYGSIDCSRLLRRDATAYTLVIHDNTSHHRTFFHSAGGSTTFALEDVNLDAAGDILHIGYALALDALDAPDAEYGTRLARLFALARARGIRTSLDVITETSTRYRDVVPPALRYSDYCIINELEAQQITGIPLRSVQGVMFSQDMRSALESLIRMGVSRWAVIHAPEGGFAMDADGHYVEQPCLNLPEDYIRGTVGAGDAFCAGVLLAAYQGRSLTEAVALGNATAALSLGDESATGAILPFTQTLAWARGLPS